MLLLCTLQKPSFISKTLNSHEVLNHGSNKRLGSTPVVYAFLIFLSYKWKNKLPKDKQNAYVLGELR